MSGTATATVASVKKESIDKKFAELSLGSDVAKVKHPRPFEFPRSGTDEGSMLGVGPRVRAADYYDQLHGAQQHSGGSRAVGYQDRAVETCRQR